VKGHLEGGEWGGVAGEGGNSPKRYSGECGVRGWGMAGSEERRTLVISTWGREGGGEERGCEKGRSRRGAD